MTYVFLQASQRGRAILQRVSKIPGLKPVLPYITIDSCTLEVSFNIFILVAFESCFQILMINTRVYNYVLAFKPKVAFNF